MIYRINQVRVNLDYSDKQVLSKVLRITRLQNNDIESLKIIRRSLDARKVPVYNLTIEIKTKKTLKKNRDVQLYNPKPTDNTSLKVNNYQGSSPIVIGAGPAGLMAALILAENGAPPIVLERGQSAKERAKEITHYISTGKLNTESNILYGEGGAGLFSDGKLTARSKERRIIKYFFEKLVECGAPEHILIDAEPHLGNDVLLKIIPALREKIIALGGKFLFNTKMEKLEITENNIVAVNSTEKEFKTDYCILATGHSARDIYKSLSKSKVALAPKSFAVGVRVELPQHIVDRSQYGKFAGNPKLGAASFRLTRKAERNFRSCYSFCMCPGGTVMPCASSEGEITTNGMSLSTRNGAKANAAFLVPVNDKDYQKYYNEKYPELSGIFFQEEIEKRIFNHGGETYTIPAARLSDFLNNKPSRSLPDDSSCQRFVPSKINNILPKYIESTLKHSIPKMLGKIGRPDFKEVVIYCGETRSSSPVRITREKETLQSENITGLYPCGEGSGYAGGIVSSAIDGIKAAESVLKKIVG